VLLFNPFKAVLNYETRQVRIAGSEHLVVVAACACKCKPPCQLVNRMSALELGTHTHTHTHAHTHTRTCAHIHTHTLRTQVRTLTCARAQLGELLSQLPADMNVENAVAKAVGVDEPVEMALIKK